MIYPHEHLAVDLSGPKKDLDCRLDQKDAIVAEFRVLNDRGVTLIVDVTNRGMGRNIAYARDVQEQCGIRILNATGWYKEGFFPPEVCQSDEETLKRIMREEILYGIDGTDAKASVIGEIGTELDRITLEEERIFIAAARLQAETGVPIVTHATMGRMGMEQIDLLQRHGADLTKVTISHVDLTNDLDYIMRLIDRGVNVAFDTIGKKAYLDDAFRVKMLKELSLRDRCGSVVLSMDITRRSHLKINEGPGYAYLIDDFLPRLRTADETGNPIPKDHITLMIRDNAARLYAAS